MTIFLDKMTACKTKYVLHETTRQSKVLIQKGENIPTLDLKIANGNKLNGSMTDMCFNHMPIAQI